MPDFNIVHSFTERLNIFNYIENMYNCIYNNNVSICGWYSTNWSII